MDFSLPDPFAEEFAGMSLINENENTRADNQEIASQTALSASSTGVQFMGHDSKDTNDETAAAQVIYNMETTDLVRRLNDASDTKYTHLTVKNMKCGTTRYGCRKVLPIDNFLRVTTSKGHTKRRAFVTCDGCRAKSRTSEKEKRGCYNDDLQHTRKVIRLLNQGKRVPEKQLRCTKCLKMRNILQSPANPDEPHLTGCTSRGMFFYFVTCTMCRDQDAAKNSSRSARLDKLRNADACEDANTPYECPQCGYTYPLSSYRIMDNEKRAESCNECYVKQGNQQIFKAAMAKTIRESRNEMDDHWDCTRCLRKLPCANFISTSKQIKDKLNDHCNFCRLDQGRQNIPGKKLCMRCKKQVNEDHFNSPYSSTCIHCLEWRSNYETKSREKGRTTYHSDYVMRLTAKSMVYKNRQLRTEFTQKHPNVADADLDAIAPVLQLNDCMVMIENLLAATGGVCELCGIQNLRFQLIEDIGHLNRASVQRISSLNGYMASNINLYCTTCNAFISNFDMQDASSLIDHVFGNQDDTESDGHLHDKEYQALINRASAKNIDPAVLIQAAQASRHRCALSKSKGTFVNLPELDVRTSCSRRFERSSNPYSIDGLTFDRIIPGAHDGLYVLENIQVINGFLNLAKKDMPNSVFLVWFHRLKDLGALRLKYNLQMGAARATSLN
ncbi:hypothetical protein BC940DRAFT_320378 [Gongronella butleri]|nr:hypothetical protein BC940DRAFT_320378 [Gongronella butleri]